jgi:hypothetical protein
VVIFYVVPNSVNLYKPVDSKLLTFSNRLKIPTRYGFGSLVVVRFELDGTAPSLPSRPSTRVLQGTSRDMTVSGSQIPGSKLNVCYGVLEH